MEEKTLETQLQKLDPKLYQCYQQTKDLAINRYIPNIPPKNGSFNSYPHIMGVMKQLNTILFSNEHSIELNATEIYLLLLAVYLHDIGKADTKSNINSHGTRSREMIEKDWAELKIDNRQLAQILKYICDLHDKSTADESAENIKESLRNETYIDGYESVRGLILGTLLFLADHMDGSYTRTAPSELADSFRKKVLGTHWFPEYQMICTYIDSADFLYVADKDNGDEFYKKYTKIEDLKGTDDGALYQYIIKKSEKKYTHIDKKTLDDIINDAYVNNEAIKLIKEELYHITKINKTIKKWMINCNGQLFTVNINKGKAEPLREKLKQLKLSLDKSGRILSFSNIGNIDEIIKKTKKVQTAKNDLAKIIKKINTNLKDFFKDYDDEKIILYTTKIIYELGKPINDPIDEYKKELFKSLKFDLSDNLLTTTLSMEPIIDEEYCKDIINNIKNFLKIFGRSHYKYEDLANAMMEDPSNIEKIKCAVKRIYILNDIYNNWNESTTTKSTIESTTTIIFYYDEVGFKHSEGNTNDDSKINNDFKKLGGKNKV